ncbi:hypothetical protein LTS18_006279 [Coniosporium uncinatum]|uniref:Uncharacterized protein n=1 Tax=Coniosporium uncinatum TaxID=93489 RepID=A0ACC3DQP7_9PEZI|nr:hypothetical protein LTS18_006279 [Coniosporium uncinatum]
MLPSGLLSTLALLLTTSQLSHRAYAFPRLLSNAEHEALQIDARDLQNSTLLAKRQCAVACGWNGQLCCASNEVCYTDAANQAQCGAATAGTAAATTEANGGYWMYYTSTYIETDLITKTQVYSSYVGPVATAQATQTATCNYALNESPCGSICCASGQYCASLGQCASAGNGGYTTVGIAPGGSYSAPARPTTATTLTNTMVVIPTTTVPFQTPVPTGSSIAGLTSAQADTGGGLSGGAIAGIVIGVILGLALLTLLLLCCCFKAALDALLACFGLGGRRKNRRTEETYIEEHHHHSSGYGGGGGSGRRWYGDRPSRPQPPKKKAGIGGALGVGAGLAGLWAALGLKRKHDRRKAEKSEYGGSSYGSSYYDTSTSSKSFTSEEQHKTLGTLMANMGNT